MSEELLVIKKKKSKLKSLIIISCIFILLGIFIYSKVVQPSQKYQEAMQLYKDVKFEEALEIFTSLNNYKDSKEMILHAKYGLATNYYSTGKYDEATEIFRELNDFKDSNEMIKKYIYYTGKRLAEQKEWDTAIEIMTTIPGFYDSDEMILKYTYNKALDKADKLEFESSIELLSTILEYNDTQELIDKCTYEIAKEKALNKDWDMAMEYLNSIPYHMDSLELIKQYNINKVLKIESKYPFDTKLIDKPTTIEDFINLFMHMGRHNILSYNIKYDHPISESEFKQLSNKCNNVFNRVNSKYPEYFSFFHDIKLTRYPINEDTLTLEFDYDEFGYSRVLEMIREFRNESYNIVNNLINSGKITNNMSDKEKAEVLYIWMAHNMAYDLDFSRESFNGYGAAILRKPTCVGYTSLYNMMCRIVGIEIEGVSGKVGQDGHQWSKAILDEDEVFIDSTWGDPTPDTKNYCNMSYFAVSEEFLSKTHKWNK